MTAPTIAAGKSTELDQNTAATLYAAFFPCARERLRNANYVGCSAAVRAALALSGRCGGDDPQSSENVLALAQSQLVQTAAQCAGTYASLLDTEQFTAPCTFGAPAPGAAARRRERAGGDGGAEAASAEGGATCKVLQNPSALEVARARGRNIAQMLPPLSLPQPHAAAAPGLAGALALNGASKINADAAVPGAAPPSAECSVSPAKTLTPGLTISSSTAAGTRSVGSSATASPAVGGVQQPSSSGSGSSASPLPPVAGYSAAGLGSGVTGGTSNGAFPPGRQATPHPNLGAAPPQQAAAVQYQPFAQYPDAASSSFAPAPPPAVQMNPGARGQAPPHHPSVGQHTVTPFMHHNAGTAPAPPPPPPPPMQIGRVSFAYPDQQQPQFGYQQGYAGYPQYPPQHPHFQAHHHHHHHHHHHMHHHPQQPHDPYSCTPPQTTSSTRVLPPPPPPAPPVTLAQYSTFQPQNSGRGAAGNAGRQDAAAGAGAAAAPQPVGFVTANQQLRIDAATRGGSAAAALRAVGNSSAVGPRIGLRRQPFVPPVAHRDDGLEGGGGGGTGGVGAGGSAGGGPGVERILGAIAGGGGNKAAAPNKGQQKRKNADSDDEGASAFPPALLLPDGSVPPQLEGLEPKLVAQIANEILEARISVGWDDIAGLTHAKDAVEEAVVWPLRNPELFTGIRNPARGLLLFGPPGTGKTMIARAIASRANCTFFNISSSALMSKWIGEGEKLVRCLFAVANVKQPSVVFIDEIDSLLTARGEGEQDAVRRVKTEFLVHLDGVATSGKERVLVVGATNRPDELDEAARRRLEKRLYIPLPDTPARRQMIQLNLRGVTCEIGDSEFEDIASRSDGYSGADLKSLCREAAMAPLRELSRSCLENVTAAALRPVQHRDFVAAMGRIRSSVGSAELVRYEKWNKEFGSFQF